MKGFFSASTVHKEKPAGLIPRCGQCGLYKTCRSPKMAPYGHGERDVLIVGEAPGQTEDEQGRPFIGKAGRYLRGMLDELDVDLDADAWTTNALICRPPKNATPDAKQISYCRPNLLNSIRKYEPQVVITLGKAALASVLAQYWKDDVGSMEKWAGWQIPIPDHWICPTFHPSYLLRINNPLMDKLFAQHLEKAFALTEPSPPAQDFESQIELLYDDQEIYESIRDFDQQGGYCSVDYETNCIKPEWPKAKIFSCAISNGKRTISFPWVGKAITATSKFLQSSRTRKIASNLKMEERWTRKVLGHGVTNWGWDTMLASHCLDNREGICSLKFQSFVKLGVCSYNKRVDPYLESRHGPYNRIHEIETGDLLFYNAQDALLTRQLANIQRKEMGL